jgi:protein SCO1
MNRGRIISAARRILVAVVAMSSACLSIAAEVADPHAHHHMDMNAANPVARSVEQYTIPGVQLMRADGRVVSFPKELDDGRPVVMDFIFTTCTTICPLSSAVLSQFQTRLGADSDKVHLVSVSIDPEQDTPERLRRYAKTFHAGNAWQYYTGTTQASEAVQRAFNVYRGNKMNHAPVTLMRAAPGSAWVRLDGLAMADDLYREYQQLLAAR